jgi:hypothetical protein
MSPIPRPSPALKSRNSQAFVGFGAIGEAGLLLLVLVAVNPGANTTVLVNS